MAKQNDDYQVTIREVYELVDSKNGKLNDSIGRLEDTVYQLDRRLANIEGRMMLVPFLISTAISVVFFVINTITK